MELVWCVALLPVFFGAFHCLLAFLPPWPLGVSLFRVHRRMLPSGLLGQLFVLVLQGCGLLVPGGLVVLVQGGLGCFPVVVCCVRLFLLWLGSGFVSLVAALRLRVLPVWCVFGF